MFQQLIRLMPETKTKKQVKFADLEPLQQTKANNMIGKQLKGLLKNKYMTSQSTTSSRKSFTNKSPELN